MILLFALAGIWLDERFGTDPLFTILLLLLGFLGATISLVKRVLATGGEKRK